MADQQCEAQRRDGTPCPKRATHHLEAIISRGVERTVDTRAVHLCGQHRNSLEQGVRAVTLHDDEGGRAAVYQDRDGNVFWDVYGEASHA